MLIFYFHSPLLHDVVEVGGYSWSTLWVRMLMLKARVVMR